MSEPTMSDLTIRELLEQAEGAISPEELLNQAVSLLLQKVEALETEMQYRVTALERLPALTVPLGGGLSSPATVAAPPEDAEKETR